MKTIEAAKFKEQCLTLLDRLDAEGLIVAKHGKPVARQREGRPGREPLGREPGGLPGAPVSRHVRRPDRRPATQDHDSGQYSDNRPTLGRGYSILTGTSLSSRLAVNAATSVTYNVPLHGIATRQSVGIEVDPFNQTMKRFLFTKLQRLGQNIKMETKKI